MKQAHLMVTNTVIPMPKEDMMKTMLLKVGIKFIFGQDHRTLGTLVMSILLLEVPGD